MTSTENSTPPEIDGAIYPFLDDRSAVDTATSIVHGRLITTDAVAGTATIDIDGVSRGDISVGDVVEVNLGIWNAPDEAVAYFFLDAQYENAVINAIDAQRRFERVMAGLPADDPMPTPVELRLLLDGADAAVVGSAFTASTDTADLDVHDVLKGDVPAQIRVRRGYDTDDSGGPWTFDPTVTRADPSVSGVFFLQHVGGEWLVMNPCDPRLTSERDLREAIA